MPFQWKIEPYQYLADMRDAYTAAIFLSSRKAADEVAEEATRWMKETAPWEDKDIVRAVRDADGEITGWNTIYPAGTARNSLRVSKMRDPGDSEWKAAMSTAKKHRCYAFRRVTKRSKDDTLL